MTIARFKENRAGAVLSAKNAGHVKGALAHLKTLLASAGLADDTQPDDGIAGPQGDENGPSPSPASAQDGTGTRMVPHFRTATLSRSRANLVESRQR